MSTITYIDRKSGKKVIEKVYHEKTLHFLYRNHPFNRFLLKLITTSPLFSSFVGWVQKQKRSKKKILPFIEKYEIDPAEFIKQIHEFDSFNDFFTRSIKLESRPLAPGDHRAVIPADGRFLFYQHIDECDGFVVKGKKFSLTTLLKNEQLARQYHDGSMVLGRLCPSDYHRFHFPTSCLPGVPILINGPLFSVNPIALKQNKDLLSENKRMVTEIKTDLFGTLLYIEIGATCVGTIHQTFKPGQHCKKGDEKGFFSFGGSSIILLFEKNQIQFDSDLLEASSQHIETLCLMGQSMGIKKKE